MMKIEIPKEYTFHQNDLLSTRTAYRGTFDFAKLKDDVKGHGDFRLKLNDKLLDTEYGSITKVTTYDGLMISQISFKSSFASRCYSVEFDAYVNTPVPKNVSAILVFADGTELNLTDYNINNALHNFDTDGAIKEGDFIQFHYEDDHTNIKSIGYVDTFTSTELYVTYLGSDKYTRNIRITPLSIELDDAIFEWNIIGYDMIRSEKPRKNIPSGDSTIYTSSADEA